MAKAKIEKRKRKAIARFRKRTRTLVRALLTRLTRAGRILAHSVAGGALLIATSVPAQETMADGIAEVQETLRQQAAANAHFKLENSEKPKTATMQEDLTAAGVVARTVTIWAESVDAAGQKQELPDTESLNPKKRAGKWAAGQDRMVGQVSPAPRFAAVTITIWNESENAGAVEGLRKEFSGLESRMTERTDSQDRLLERVDWVVTLIAIIGTSLGVLITIVGAFAGVFSFRAVSNAKKEAVNSAKSAVHNFLESERKEIEKHRDEAKKTVSEIKASGNNAINEFHNEFQKKIEEASQQIKKYSKGENEGTLFAAIGKDDIEAVEKIVHEGANVNTPDERGFYPIETVAMSTRSPRMIRTLAKLGANISCIPKAPSVPPLHRKIDFIPLILAIMDAKIHSDGKAAEMTRAFIQCGVSPDIMQERFMTPLHMAAYCNDPETISILCKAGADINAKHAIIDFPVFHAAYHDSLDAIRELMKHGADIKASTPGGRNILHAAAEGNAVKSIPALIKLGVDPNAHTNKNRNTPLHNAAAAFGDRTADAIDKLIVGGAKVNSLNKNGETPMDLALKNKNYSVAAALKKLHGKQSAEL